MLIQLIYASTATEPVTDEMVESILKVARLRNELRDVTGMLVFDHQYFLQVLEGERQSLNQLFGKLMKDARHGNLTLISCTGIQERSHATWAMGFASASSANKALFLRHGTSSRFDPYALSTVSALALIADLSKHPAPAIAA